MKNRQIRIIAVLLATVLAYAGLIGAAAVTAQAADNAPVVQPVTAQTCVDITVEAELSDVYKRQGIKPTLAPSGEWHKVNVDMGCSFVHMEMRREHPEVWIALLKASIVFI